MDSHSSSGSCCVPFARIAEFVGHGSIKETADTYTHVLMDERELDYATLLRKRP